MDRPVFNPASFGAGRVPVTETVRDDTPFDPAALKQAMQEKKQQVINLRTAPLGPVKAWSMSRLFEFESCKHAVYLGKVEKMPSPSGPAADRGTKIHEHIERYIRGEHTEVIKEMAHFLKLIDHLREGFADARVEVEGDWAFTRDWQVTEWAAPNSWARFKLDALDHESETSAFVYDWKTGKKFGNEMKHNQQGMGYAIAAFRRFPALEYVGVKMAYLDQKDELVSSYTRQQAALLEPGLTLRGDKMTTCTDFTPSPSFHACRWCPFAKVQEGQTEPACKFRYEGLS